MPRHARRAKDRQTQENRQTASVARPRAYKSSRNSGLCARGCSLGRHHVIGSHPISELRFPATRVPGLLAGYAAFLLVGHRANWIYGKLCGRDEETENLPFG